MKASKLFLVISMASGLVLVGQQYTDFSAGMKEVDLAWQALQKLDSRTGKTAAHQAENIGYQYENMIGFWRRQDSKDTADAVKIATQGKAAAAMLATAAYSGKTSEAEAAYKTLGETCQSCHDAHREKLADGAFRLILKKK